MDNSMTESSAGSPARADLGGLVARFAASIDGSVRTRELYGTGLRRFLEWLRQESDRSPDRETIIAFKRHLSETGMAASTVSAYLVAVRRFFAWAESVRLYPNVARDIKGAKATRGHRRDSLTLSQVLDLLSSIDRTSETGQRDHALLTLLVSTGLRTIEIILANVEDIRSEGAQVVLWVRGKGRDTKDDFVILADHVYKPILAYLSCRGALSEASPLFASTSNRNPGSRLTTRAIRGTVKRRLREVGLDSSRLTAHSLRHTAVTLALQAGASVQEAQAMARHANINTTMVYAHNLNRIDNGAELKLAKLLDGGE